MLSLQGDIETPLFFTIFEKGYSWKPLLPAIIERGTVGNPCYLLFLKRGNPCYLLLLNGSHEKSIVVPVLITAGITPSDMRPACYLRKINNNNIRTKIQKTRLT